MDSASASVASPRRYRRTISGSAVSALMSSSEPAHALLQPVSQALHAAAQRVVAQTQPAGQPAPAQDLAPAGPGRVVGEDELAASVGEPVQTDLEGARQRLPLRGIDGRDGRGIDV